MNFQGFRPRFPSFPMNRPQPFAFNRQPQAKFAGPMPPMANPQPQMSQPAAPSATAQAPIATPSPAQFVPTGRSQQAKDFSVFENQVRQQYGITDPQQVNQMAQQLRYDQTQDPAVRKTYQEQLFSQGLPVYQPGTLQFVNRENHDTVFPDYSDAAFNKNISGYDQATQEKLLAERKKDMAGFNQGQFTGTPMPSEFATIEPWLQGGAHAEVLPSMPGMPGGQPPNGYMEDGPAGTPQPLNPQQMQMAEQQRQMQQALRNMTPQQMMSQVGAGVGGMGGVFGGAPAASKPTGPTMNAASMPSMSLVEPWLQGPQQGSQSRASQSLPGAPGGLLAY